MLPHQKQRLYAWGALAIGAIIFITALTSSDEPVRQAPSVQTEASPSRECYTKEGYIAAISEKYLSDAVRYSIDKDYVAIQKLIDAGVIVQMKKGIRVHIVDTHILSGKVEFRLPGETDVLWTVIEAISC